MYICELKESYERGELSRLPWIPGGYNRSDALTNQMVKNPPLLWSLIQDNHIDLKPVGWASVPNKISDAHFDVSDK